MFLGFQLLFWLAFSTYPKDTPRKSVFIFFEQTGFKMFF